MVLTEEGSCWVMCPRREKDVEQRQGEAAILRVKREQSIIDRRVDTFPTQRKVLGSQKSGENDTA